jgi:peptidyl-prolyl cis-trans isomerase C
MKIVKIITLSCLATLAACGGGNKPAAAEPKPVATVNGKSVSRATFDYVVKSLAGKASGELTVKERDQVLDEIVRSEVVAQEAEKQGLDKQGDTAAALSMARLQLLQAAAGTAYLKDKKPTDAEMKAEYDTQVAAMPKMQYKAHHILVKTEPEARAVLARLKKGEKFEAIAKDVSLDTSKTNGGDLGDFFNPNAMVAPFAAALQTLKKGEITQAPVQTDFGFHIIRLDDTRATTAPPYEAVKTQLEQMVQQKKFKAYSDNLVKQAKIEKNL